MLCLRKDISGIDESTAFVINMSLNKLTGSESSPDWHPADVVAALRKQGWSLRRLSREHGYSPTALANALRDPWPKAEGIIAMAIGTEPQSIWPSRYHQDGTPKSGRGQRAASRSPRKPTSAGMLSEALGTSANEPAA